MDGAYPRFGVNDAPLLRWPLAHPLGVWNEDHNSSLGYNAPPLIFDNGSPVGFPVANRDSRIREVGYQPTMINYSPESGHKSHRANETSKFLQLYSRTTSQPFEYQRFSSNKFLYALKAILPGASLHYLT